MDAADGREPITPDELLFRRIPVSQGWHDPDTGVVADLAFRPNRNDGTGLSLGRAKYKTPEEEAALGRGGKEYFVAVLRAGDVLQMGVQVTPDPLPSDPGHVEIPALTYENRKSGPARELQVRLARSVQSVAGPFPGSQQRT